MGKYLAIFRDAAALAEVEPASEQPRPGYDKYDINDESSGGRGLEDNFSRLCRFGRILDELEHQRPDDVETADWQQAIQDGSRFASQWGEEAHAIGWTEADLFRLHEPPETPVPNYRRLSRLDATGLIWLLRGRPVIALTATEAVFRAPSGAILTCPRSPPARVAKRAL
jgi:hypothetical protein